MLVGIYDENGQKYNDAQCICKHKELSELFCPVSDVHEVVYELKIPTVSHLASMEYICDKRLFYDYNQPVFQSVKEVYPLLRGKTYHAALLKDVKMKEVNLMARVNGGLLSGTIDAYDPCTQMLYEVKTTKSLPDRPRPWDFRQIQLYHWLLDQYGYGVKTYRNLYITYDDYIFYDNPPQLLPDDIVQTMAADANQHIKQFFGKYKQMWACAYCNYYRWCKMGIENLKQYDAENRTRPVSKRRHINVPSAGPNDPIVTIEHVLSMQPDIVAGLTPDYMTLAKFKPLEFPRMGRNGGVAPLPSPAMPTRNGNGLAEQEYRLKRYRELMARGR